MEIPAIETSVISPLKENEYVNINGTLAVGQEGDNMTIRLNGKVLDAAKINDKVDKSGDTMTGDLVMNSASIIFEGCTEEETHTRLSTHNIYTQTIHADIAEIAKTLTVNGINVTGSIKDNSDSIITLENRINFVEEIKANTEYVDSKLSLKADKSSVEGKASSRELADLSETVNANISDLSSKVTANESAINSVNLTLNAHRNSDAHITTEERQQLNTLRDKADKSTVDALSARVSTNTANITNIQSAINGKADKNDVEERLTAAENQINCVEGTVTEHVNNTSKHLSQDDINTLRSVAEKASAEELARFKEEVTGEVTGMQVSIAATNSNVAANTSNIADLSAEMTVVNADIEELKDKTQNIPGSGKIEELEAKINANTAAINVNTSNFENHIVNDNTNNRNHLTKDDRDAIEAVDSKASQADVEALQDLTARHTCYIEKIWEEIDSRKGEYILRLGDTVFGDLVFKNIYKTEKYADIQINGTWIGRDHFEDNVRHVTEDDRTRWDNKGESFTAEGTENPDITTTLEFVSNEESGQILKSAAMLNKATAVEEITDDEIKAPATNAIKAYVDNKLTEFVPKTGCDDMSGEFVISDDKENTLKLSAGETAMRLNGDVHTTGGEYIGYIPWDISFDTKYVKNANIEGIGECKIAMPEVRVSDTESANVSRVLPGEVLVSDSASGNVSRVLPGEVRTIDIWPSAGNGVNLHGDVHVTDRIMVNWVTPNTGNTITFYNVNSEGTAAENVTVAVTNGPVSNKGIKMVAGPEIPCEIYINNGDPVYGEVGVYDHITNPHVHLTEKQLDILNAAEKGCFAYGPVKPDPDHEEDPYKFRNPKVLLTHKDGWSDGHGEISLQVGSTNEAYIELVNTDRITNTISISSGYDNGSAIEVTDDGITIKTANPHSAVQNAPLNVMGDTAIGNSDTNYKFTVNGVDITPDKKQVDTKNNDDYTSAGNANGAMCVIEPLSNADDVTLKSLTFTTRSGGSGPVPNGKKMALYCCNADEAPSPFKQNATAQNTKYELPAGWKYIGISKNSYTGMAFNTKYKYEFDDIKIEKGMMIAISFTDFEDLTETQFAWSGFGMQGRVNKTPEDHKNTFYNTSLVAATTPKSGVNYRYTINYTAEFVKDHTAKPIADTETPILYDGSIYNVTGDSITVVATDIHNQVAKSTIVFTPTVDVNINNVFTDPVDKTICYEETLLQGKVSIIEITHVNVNGTNYITATITPNIK